MGIRQLASLPVFVKRRQHLAKIYDDEFASHPDIKLVEPADKKGHNYFKYLIILPNHDRAAVHKALESASVQPSGYVYELPLHKQPVFPESNKLHLPKTEYVCEHHLCLPIFYSMTDEQAHHVAATLKEILKKKA